MSESGASGRVGEDGIVLVVDDSPDALRLLTDAIETTGASVLVALSGEEALSIAGRLTPEYVAFAATTYARLARPFLPADVTPDLALWRRQQWAAFAQECRHPLRAAREAWNRAW